MAMLNAFAYRPEEAAALTKQMLGHKLVTKQTGPQGTLVSKVMLAQSVDLKRETYFAILMDRAFAGPVMVASPKGGMDIEQVAEETPDLIFKVDNLTVHLHSFCFENAHSRSSLASSLVQEPIDIDEGIKAEQTRRLATAMGFEGEQKIVDVRPFPCKEERLDAKLIPFTGPEADGQLV